MFTKEYRVKGQVVTGKIVSNYSRKSYYAFHLESFSTTSTKFSEDYLEILAREMRDVADKVRELNRKHESGEDN